MFYLGVQASIAITLLEHFNSWYNTNSIELYK